MNVQNEMCNLVAEICHDMSCSKCPLNGICTNAITGMPDDNTVKLVRKVYKELFFEVSEEEVMNIFK